MESSNNFLKQKCFKNPKRMIYNKKEQRRFSNCFFYNLSEYLVVMHLTCDGIELTTVVEPCNLLCYDTTLLTKLYNII